MRHQAVADLNLWDTWQHTVRAGLPWFARSPYYVDQDNTSQSELEAIVQTLAPDPIAQLRDVKHGARTFQTKALGALTRMWVDGCIETRFLQRVLPTPLAEQQVLEIGAGYGRLAVMLAPIVASYTCVDPVPVSVQVCRTYTDLYAPGRVTVLDAQTFSQASPHWTLAINIHSWNECTLPQVEAWLDVLTAPLLFTVSHGTFADGWAYRVRVPMGESFRPALLARYRLITEESIGLGGHPHALWKRR